MQLAKYEGFEIAEIGAIADIAVLLQKIKQIDALKVALESCEKFRENAIRYAKLEAAALMRAVELDGASKLKGYKRKVAEWLFDLEESERAQYIRMCEDGLTIDQVWKREVYDEEKTRRNLGVIYDLREGYIEDAKKEGIVDLSYFAKEARATLPGSLASDVIDGLRNSLRKAGAVGIGGDTGIYVMPTPQNADKVRDAILQRFESVAADLAKIKEIANAAGLKMNYEDFGVDIYLADRSSKGYLLHVLIALDRIGLIANNDQMYTEFAKSSCYDEIAYVEKLGIAHGVKAAEMILDSYKKKESDE